MQSKHLIDYRDPLFVEMKDVDMSIDESHLLLFLEFASAKRFVSEPDSHIEHVAQMGRYIEDERERLWMLGLYAAFYNMYTGWVAFNTIKDRSYDGILAYCNEHTRFLPRMGGRLSVKSAEQLAQCLFSLSEWCKGGSFEEMMVVHGNKHLDDGEVYHHGFDAVQDIDKFGNYINIRFLETIHRAMNWRGLAPTVHMKNAPYSRLALAAIWPQHAERLQKESRDSHVLGTYLADRLYAAMGEYEIDCDRAQQEAMLCEYRAAMGKNGEYPGVSYDGALPTAVALSEYWGRDLVKIPMEVRLEHSPFECLGEHNGWGGLRPQLLHLMRDHLVVWNDIEHSFKRTIEHRFPLTHDGDLAEMIENGRPPPLHPLLKSVRTPKTKKVDNTARGAIAKNLNRFGRKQQKRADAAEEHRVAQISRIDNLDLGTVEPDPRMKRGLIAFASRQVAAGEPNSHVRVASRLAQSRIAQKDYPYFLALYSAFLSVPTAWAVYNHLPANSTDAKMAAFFETYWDNLPRRGSGRSVNSAAKMTEAVRGFVNWHESSFPDMMLLNSDPDYADAQVFEQAWESMTPIKSLGTTALLCALECYKPLFRWRGQNARYRVKELGPPLRDAVAMLFPEFADLMDSNESVVEQLTARLHAILAEEAISISVINLQSCLLEFRSAFGKSGRYVGQSYDEDYTHIGKLMTRWDATLFEPITEARRATAPIKLLAEETQKWSSIRRDLLPLIRDQGFYWTDFEYSYPQQVPVRKNAMRGKTAIPA